MTRVPQSLIVSASFQIIESTKAWRDAWVSIATFQSRMADEFDGLYAPILGSSETETRHIPEETPPALLSRTNNLRREFDDLRGELVQELSAVEQRMSQPAEQAKSYLAPMKKAIKKRNEKKVREGSVELTFREDHILITTINSRITSAFRAKSMASSINQSAPIARMSILPRQKQIYLQQKRYKPSIN